MLKLISIVDTITNSSDELFIMKSGEQDKKRFLIDFISSLKCMNEEDKETYIEKINDGSFKSEIYYNIDEYALVELDSQLSNLVYDKPDIFPIEVLQSWYDRIFEDLKNHTIEYYEDSYAYGTMEYYKATEYHTEEYVHNPQLYVFNVYNDNRDTFFPRLEVLMEYKERYQDIFDYLINFFKDKIIIAGTNAEFFWYFSPYDIEEDFDKYGIIYFDKF